MKILVLPADEGGCGKYRLIWPGQALRAQGHDVIVDFDRTFRAVWQPAALGDRIIGLDEQVEADVVVLQRPLQRNRVELIDALQTQGVCVVVEIDDDFHAIHRRNPAWRDSNPLHDPDRNRDWLMRACDRADLVTVSTPALAARYGHHGRVRVLPNCVPERYLDVRAEPHDGMVVGWSGSVLTHPGDLEVTKGGVAKAVRESGARFGVVGTGVGVKDALGLDSEPDAAGWLPIDDYPAALARFDVGIVPLAPHVFNEAKSWLKGLEYAAVGVPFVASSTEQYRRLREKRAGMIAESPAEWHQHVSTLIRDPGARRICQDFGREAAAKLTIEGNAWKWLEAWSDAVGYRDARRAA